MQRRRASSFSCSEFWRRYFSSSISRSEPYPIPTAKSSPPLTGSGNDPVTTKIILNIRLLKAVVALLAGAALAVSGLQMQTLFRNPLAGPYVLGISSGASLGVAIFLLGRSASGPHGTPANLHPRHCGRCLDRLGADPDADRCGQPPESKTSWSFSSWA